MRLAGKCPVCKRRIFATRRGQGVKTTKVGFGLAHTKCLTETKA